MDRLAPFLDDCCLLDPERRVSSKDLYAAYQRWRQEEGEKAWSQIRFTKAIQERAKDVSLTRNKQQRGWVGIGLNEEMRGKLGFLEG